MSEREFHLNSIQIYNLADKSDCSSYDCEFIHLADDLDTKLITMDNQICVCFLSYLLNYRMALTHNLWSLHYNISVETSTNSVTCSTVLSS